MRTTAKKKAVRIGLLDPPELEPNTLRPYLISDDLNPYLWGKLSFGFRTFDDPDRVWNAVDAIKHRLLYCHAVAVHDPLSTFFSIAMSRGINEPDVIDKRANILNFINFILHMKPLIERRIFSLITDAYAEQFEPPFISNLFRKFGPRFGDEPKPSEFPPLVLSESEIDEFRR